MKDIFLENLNELISLTKEKSIIWNKTHGSFYIWHTKDESNEDVNVIIQIVSRNEKNKVDDLLFRIYNPKRKIKKIDITADQTTKDIREKLFELLKTIQQTDQMGDIGYFSTLVKRAREKK